MTRRSTTHVQTTSADEPARPAAARTSGATTAATDARADPAARTAALRALAEEASARFAALEETLAPDELAAAVSAWAAHTFGADLAVACSMADAVLPHVVSQHRPGVDVLFLETGYHFPETLRTRDRVARELDVTVVDVLPERTVPQQDADLGAQLHDRDPAACCALRKVDPLRRALSGYDAWVTGVRREEGPTRADTPLVTYDEAFDLVKINPPGHLVVRTAHGVLPRPRPAGEPTAGAGLPEHRLRAVHSRRRPGRGPPRRPLGRLRQDRMRPPSGR